MDVLKEITDGLRKGDENAQDETEATDSASRQGRESHGSRDSYESTSKPSDEGPELERSGSSAGEPNGDDVHVCSFCETEFDAGRETCPECDARIVLRGAR